MVYIHTLLYGLDPLAKRRRDAWTRFHRPDQNGSGEPGLRRRQLAHDHASHGMANGNRLVRSDVQCGQQCGDVAGDGPDARRLACIRRESASCPGELVALHSKA